MKAGFLMLLLGIVATQAADDRPTPGTPSSPTPFVQPVNPNDEALDLYARLTGRTVLRPGGLRPLPASIKAEVPADRDAAIPFIENELAKNQIEIVPDGELFARVLPAGWRNSPLAAYLGSLKPPAHDPQIATNIIKFPSVDVDTLLTDFYAPVANRTLLRCASLPGYQIRLVTMKPLTREECIYAFNTLLAMNGVAALADGEKFLQIVPLSAASRVQLRAPKPGPGAPVVDLPAGKDPANLRGRPAFVPHPPGVLPVSNGRLLGGFKVDPSVRFYDPELLIRSYAALTGRTASIPYWLAPVTIVIQSQAALTKSEVLYAIETSLRLNGLILETGEDNSVSVLHISEYLRRQKASPSKPEKL